jgi:hypothetical protein
MPQHEWNFNLPHTAQRYNDETERIALDAEAQQYSWANGDRAEFPVVFDSLTAEQKRIMDEFAANHPPRRQLHWYQWVVYTVVLLTCIAVLYGMLETWLMVQAIQDAAERFANGLGNI